MNLRGPDRSTATRHQILLVEDNAADARLIREMLTDQLGEANFELCVGQSVSDALRLIDDHLPDVVLLDLSLSDSFGLETLYKIQNRSHTLPIVVLTGNQDEQLALKAVKAGAQDYLAKHELTGGLLVKAMQYARERKLIEATLRISEARFRSLAELSSDWYWEQDEMQVLTFLSEGLADKCGVDPASLIGRRWWEVPWCASADNDWSRLKTAMDAREPFQDIVLRCGTTPAVHISISGLPVVEHGTFIGYRGLGKDVSFREQAAAALRGSEERFRRMMESGREGILILDPQGRIVFANREIAMMLGYEESALTGLHMAELAYEEEPGRVPAALLEHGAAVALRRGDGGVLIAMQAIHPIQAQDGSRSGSLAVITDLTEFNHREERVRQLATLAARKSEAERANAAKSRFVAAVSHDLRQPMHALVLFLDNLKGAELPEHARRIVGQMDSALQSTQLLLDSILVMSRLENGMIAASLAPFAIQPLLDRLRLGFEGAAKKKGLGLRVRASRAVVNSDMALLERILSNLVSNALRYTDHGGVLVTCRKRAAGLLVEVWDTGRGIALEHQESVFQEFFRIENAREDGGGIGLGLTIVRSCSALLDCAVALGSVPGRGSRFSLVVPYGELPAGAAEPEADEADAEGTPFEGLHVLIVDNDVDILQGTSNLLERWGCEVTRASSGPQAEALLAMKAFVPDIVISDLRLDDGELGTDLVTRMRRRYRQNLPAVIVSGDTSLHTAREVRRHGLKLLYKPLPPTRLRAVIANLLNA
jgi:PAS domain S-box-containing protein